MLVKTKKVIWGHEQAMIYHQSAQLNRHPFVSFAYRTCRRSEQFNAGALLYAWSSVEIAERVLNVQMTDEKCRRNEMSSSDCARATTNISLNEGKNDLFFMDEDESLIELNERLSSEVSIQQKKRRGERSLIKSSIDASEALNSARVSSPSMKSNDMIFDWTWENFSSGNRWEKGRWTRKQISFAYLNKLARLDELHENLFFFCYVFFVFVVSFLLIDGTSSKRKRERERKAFWSK